MHVVPAPDLTPSFGSYSLALTGNILIDTLARRWYGKEFDSDGKIVGLAYYNSQPIQCFIVLLPRVFLEKCLLYSWES